MQLQLTTKRRHTKTHCAQGHLFSQANLYVRKNGKWMCKACSRIRKAAHLRSQGIAPRPPIEDRIAAKIQQSETCWIWQGLINNNGYGVTGIGQRKIYVHRWMYERFKGAIPPKLEIDHLCRIPRCVRPDHLEAVSHRDNMARGILIHDERGRWCRPE